MEKKLRMMSASLLAVSFAVTGLLAGCGTSSNSSSQAATAGSNSTGSGNSSNNSSQSGGTSAQTPKDGGTLVVGLSGNPQTFNPDAQIDSIFDTVAQNVFSRLVEFNSDQQIIPDLAKSWDISSDGKTYTFHLHPNVTWQDGTPFSSADVKYTLEAIQKNKGYISSALSEITNISTPDNNTVVIQISKPDNSFLGTLGGQGAYILPQHTYQNSTWAQGTTGAPIGTGPFKFSSYTPGTSVTLVKNSSYFGQVPHVDKLVFSIIQDPNAMLQSFLNGNIDVYGGTLPGSAVAQLKNNPNVVSKPTLWPSPYYVAFNMTSKPFNDPNVREAVAYALDDQSIIDKTMPGQAQPATYFISPLYKWALNKDYPVPSYNPTKAKSLLQQAGYTPGSINVTMTIASMYQSIATVVKYQLGQVGINVNLNVLDFGTWQKQVMSDKKFQVTVMANYEAPTVASVNQIYMTGGSSNFMGYSNPNVDKDLQQALTVVSQSAQAKDYQDAQKYIAKDLPIVPIMDWLGYMPVQSYVEGYPTSQVAINHTSNEEYNYAWLNK